MGRAGKRGRSLLFAAIVTGTTVVAVPAAGADVITPPGACSASGTWQESGQTEASADHVPSDVIEIPRSDTVAWMGSVGGHAVGDTGPRRAIAGRIQLDLPIGTVTIDDWDGESESYANSGERSYDLPSLLTGIEVRLHGEHREDGAVVCSGEVGMKVAGSVWSNPLSYGSLVVLAVSAAGLVAAARPAAAKGGTR